jgi:hypothetical protein
MTFWKEVKNVCLFKIFDAFWGVEAFLDAM